MDSPEYKILYINVNFSTGAQKYYLYVLNLCVDRRLHNKLQQAAKVSAAADTDYVWESVVDSVTKIIRDFLYAYNLHKGKSYTLTA